MSFSKGMKDKIVNEEVTNVLHQQYEGQFVIGDVQSVLH